MQIYAIIFYTIYISILLTLTPMGEMRDPYTAGHELRVYSIAVKIRGSSLPFPSCANCDSFDIMLNILKGYIPHHAPCAMPYTMPHAPFGNAMRHALSHPTPCPMPGSPCHMMDHALYPTPCGNAIRHTPYPMRHAVTPCPMHHALRIRHTLCWHTPCTMPYAYAMPSALIVDCDSFDIMLNRMSKKVMGLRLNRGKPANRC